MRRQAKKFILGAALAVAFLTLALKTTYALNGFLRITPPEVAELSSVTISSTVTLIIRFIFIGAFVISFLVLAIGGIRWMLSGGDEKAVASARGMVTGAVIGLVLVLAAFAVIRLVEFFFRVTIISGGTVTLPGGI